MASGSASVENEITQPILVDELFDRLIDCLDNRKEKNDQVNIEMDASTVPQLIAELKTSGYTEVASDAYTHLNNYFLYSEKNDEDVVYLMAFAIRLGLRGFFQNVMKSCVFKDPARRESQADRDIQCKYGNLALEQLLNERVSSHISDEQLADMFQDISVLKIPHSHEDNRYHFRSYILQAVYKVNCRQLAACFNNRYFRRQFIRNIHNSLYNDVVEDLNTVLQIMYIDPDVRALAEVLHAFDDRLSRCLISNPTLPEEVEQRVAQSLFANLAEIDTEQAGIDMVENIKEEFSPINLKHVQHHLTVLVEENEHDENSAELKGFKYFTDASNAAQVGEWFALTIGIRMGPYVPPAKTDNGGGVRFDSEYKGAGPSMQPNQ